MGREAPGVRWEPLDDARTPAGSTVLVLTPRQTASWAASLGVRAKTDQGDAGTPARGLLAGLGRARTLPAEQVQARRARTRARRDLIPARTAARPRVHDELVLMFPALVRLLAPVPADVGLGSPRVRQVLCASSSAQAFTPAACDAVATTLREASAGRWGTVEAEGLRHAAPHAAARTRAVAARRRGVRPFAQQALHLHAQIAELEAAIPALLDDDPAGQRRQQMPGSGPHGAATLRAELGERTRFRSVDAVVAYAGRDPRTPHSGAFVGQKHLSQRGPGAWRHAL